MKSRRWETNCDEDRFQLQSVSLSHPASTEMHNGAKMLNVKRLKTCWLFSIAFIVITLLLTVYSENVRRLFSLDGVIKIREPFKQPPNSNNEPYEIMEQYQQDTTMADPPFKKILFWNDYFRVPDFYIGLGREALLKWNCPVWQCEISRDRTDIQDYDAVIFHLHTWTLNDLPQRRSSHQRYVAWMLESAAWHEYYYDTNPMANFFNWTVTYRWDSDFVRPYGYVKPIGNVPIHPNESQMKEYLSNSKVMPMDANGKTKMATWFVSNCNSEKSSRDELVKQLQNYMQIDVFGKCGTFACRKNDELNDSSEQCQEMAALNYKFYLSLENSLCQDYITEKFFYMLHRPIIPIVYGVHDHYDKIAPPHSFINAAKFENMKQLADYLILLDKNDTLYNEYFWWKPHFEVKYVNVNDGVCHLCASLHNTTLPPKIYRNMTDWWERQAYCVYPPHFS